MNKEKGKFFRVVDRAEDICLVTMFALMVASIFLQVIMRFLVNDSLTWSEELGKFFFVWISWLGISIAERRNEHIKITLVTDRLSPRLQAIVDIIAKIVLLGILGVTIFYAVMLVSSQSHVHYAGIKISTSWGYLSLVLGCGFMVLRILGGIMRHIQNLRTGNFPVPETEGMEGGTN